MPRMTGRVIAGRYALSAPIGRGAMGVVWRAHDQLLDREVAVKEVVLSAAIGEDEQRNAYQRTLREARTAARLSHRGVVTIYDVAEEDGRPFIVMELVPSQSLDQVVAAEGPMTPLRAGRMGQQLLAALATAHAAGVLHRDVKPSNVLIADDKSGVWDERAVLTDFGIAQFEGDPRLTQTGMVMGSPGFTAPERIRGGDATSASDLWSLGATVYTAVEGRGPYEQRGGAITTMSAIINEDAPVAPSAGRLGPLIAALLRREPSARPTAAAAARMFAEVLPLLTNTSTHPATVRSPFVPAPAAPAASVVPGDVQEPAADSRDAAAGVAGAASADAAGAVGAADPAAPAKAAAVDAAMGAAAAVAAAAPPAAAAAPPSAAPVAEVAAGDGAGAVAAANDGDRADAQAGEPLPASAAPDSKLASAPAPTDRAVPLPPPVSPQPKPTFTASKRNASATPPVSASRPASPAPASPPVPAQPPPLFSASKPARPADPPTMPEPAQYYGPGAPYAGASGGQYAGGQYAGPSQDYPGLAQQYAPGTGGRPRRSRRGRRIALVVGAVVVAAAAGGGAALALHQGNNAAATTNTTNAASLKNQPGSVQALDTPSTTVPAGFTPFTVSPSASGTTAGFTIDVPSSWTETRSGLVTDFKDDNGDRLLEVDLTPHTYTNMVTEAQFIESQSEAKGRFPDYKRFALKAVPVRGTSGAFWQFTWDRNGITARTDDILFIDHTPNGPQSYAIYFRAPNNGWNSKFLPQFEKMLSTFQIAAT
jgi:tRNA A-37 threonylcarbamoyl transferase component Bud32